MAVKVSLIYQFFTYFLDIDECGEDNFHPTCDINGYCKNVWSSFDCKCNSGFSGEGEAGTCENSDECYEESHDCGSSANCVDRNGGFVCECDEGYLLDLATNECYNWDECSNELTGHDCPLHTHECFKQIRFNLMKGLAPTNIQCFLFSTNNCCLPEVDTLFNETYLIDCLKHF